MIAPAASSRDSEGGDGWITIARAIMTSPHVEVLKSVSSENRITSLDVARGIALFGILMVNVQLLCQPLSWVVNGGGSNEGPVGRVVYYATRLFFESKSYPLFSLLFGMGLMLMRERAIAAGRSFAKPYLRRLSLLLLMGALHAVLLYYADVLVIYSLVGFFTMWFMGRKSKVLLGLALSLLTLAFLWSVLGVFMAARFAESGEAPSFAGESAQAVTVETVAEDAAFREFYEKFKEGDIPKQGPMSSEWEAAARDAFRNGPLSHAMQMRSVEWLAEQLSWTIGSGALLRIAGMFFLGAWLMKVDALGARTTVWIRRLILIGCVVGMPTAVTSVVLAEVATPNSPVFYFSYSLIALAGPCFALGYMGLSMWLAQRFAASGVVRSIAFTGRMALTNYIMQSFLVCVIVQHWGFGMYGEISQAQMLVIAVSIYLLQLIVSPLWLARFTMGPLEWAWRSWTYLRRPTFLKA